MLFPLLPSSSKFFTVLTEKGDASAPTVTIGTQLEEAQNNLLKVPLSQLLTSKKLSKHSVIAQNVGQVRRRISDILIVEVEVIVIYQIFLLIFTIN